MNFCLKAIHKKYTTKARYKNVKSKIDFQLDLQKNVMREYALDLFTGIAIFTELILNFINTGTISFA